MPSVDMEVSSGKETNGERDEGNCEDTTDDGSKKVEEAPKVGMTFSSKEEVHGYYASYALQEGFEIMTRSSRLGDDGNTKYFTLACARGGKTVCTSLNTFKPNPTKKTDCEARINVVLCSDGKFGLSKIVLEHNHSLIPGKTRYFRSNKKTDSHVKRRLESNDQSGINVGENIDSLVVAAGGHEYLSCTEKDCGNYVEKARVLRLGTGDAEAILCYFTKMQDKNSSFFYVMDLNDDGCLRNVFWCDPRSRAAYECFGDVITFDSTYLTNKYDMPFSLFVGVNHHGQSVLLGCGLLSNEDTETYVWLFRAWLASMSEEVPKAIITDQCKAIQEAIAKVFPKTRHRFCLQRIMEKIPKKFSGYSRYELIRNALHGVVYDSPTPNEFEEGWKEMIESYGLESNEWLQNLYDDRHRWVPAFVKDTFWAGMSPTQRSESMNAFFDGYVNSKTTLKQFIEQYDNALRSKVEKENQADDASFHFTIPLITNFDIEKQFQEVYTIEKFKEFQEELRSLMYCNVSFVKQEGCISKFEVEDSIKFGDSMKDVSFNVCYNEKECEVDCMCHLFEFRGILCRHAIAVLNKKKVKKVPPRYILPRWRKDLRRRHSFIKSSYTNNETNEQVQRYDKLCNYFYEIAEIGAESKESRDRLMGYLREVKEKMQRCDDNKSTSPCLPPSPCNEDVPGISNVSARELSPLPVQAKGRPPSKRKESDVDQLVRKKRTSQEKTKQNIPSKSNKSKQKQANTSCSLGGASMCNNYPDSSRSQTQSFGYSNQTQLPDSCYNGMGVNVPNLFMNHQQPYPIPYMVMHNQLPTSINHLVMHDRLPTSVNHLSSLQKGIHSMPTTSNEGIHSMPTTSSDNVALPFGNGTRGG